MCKPIQWPYPVSHPSNAHPPHHGFSFHLQSMSHLENAIVYAGIKLTPTIRALGNRKTMRFHNQLRGYFTIFSDDLLFTFHCCTSLTHSLFCSFLGHPHPAYSAIA